MTASKRVRLSPEARRAQLIELGVDMLATRRLDELSVELIAHSAGISRGLLFHYFASKQDFHLEVARAAAADMIRRTEPDHTLPPVEALRSGLNAFVDYVEQNPDNYKSLVRGAASGDDEMRAIFDRTRTTMAQRIIDDLTVVGMQMNERTMLAIHGWVAFVEECVIRWIDARSLSRAELLEMLTKSLPALTLSAADEDVATLVSILASETALGGGDPDADPNAGARVDRTS